jgi:hypothetical protein
MHTEVFARLRVKCLFVRSLAKSGTRQQTLVRLKVQLTWNVTDAMPMGG